MCIWLVWSVTQSKLKIITIQWIKPGIWDVIDESYIKHLAKIQLCAVFHSRVIWKSVSSKIYRALYGNVMLVPFRGAPTYIRNICQWVLPLERKIILLECRHIKSSTSSIVRTVQLAKTWAITPLLTYAKALSSCHLLSRNSKTLKFKRPL